MRNGAAGPAGAPSVAERVAERIREQIRTGRFAPGQHLTEAQLALRFGASRGPIREALRRLEGDGILSFEKNRGARVRRLGRDDFVHFLELREALESLAARLLARQPCAGATIEQLTRLYRRMDRAVKRSELERYNNSLYVPFHSLLIEASGNPLLTEHWRRLNLDVLRQQFRPLVDLELVRRAHREHAELLAALRAREAGHAERAVREHIVHFTEHVRRLPERVFASSQAPQA